MGIKEAVKYVESCENHIRTHGITNQLVEGYVGIAKNLLIEEPNHVDYALKVSARAKDVLEEAVRQRTNGAYDLWGLEKYAFANNTQIEIVDTNYEILLLEARRLQVDSYFRYLEKNREPVERFYMPKRKVFYKHELTQSFQGLIDDKYDILCISLPPGTGKCSRLNAKVLTPDGFVEMRDIHVGDKVIAGTGKVAKVLGVFPQGEKPCYRVTLKDGSYTEVSDDHIWYVQNRYDRDKKYHPNGKYRTVTTTEMLKNLKIEHGKRLNYSIDYVPKIDFKEKDLFIHPYVLGCLLGDGSFRKTIRLSNPENEIVDKINSLIGDFELKRVGDSNKEYYIRSKGTAGKPNLIKRELERLGLIGTKSDTKFIPKDYLYASHEQRLWLLRGLLDTDGYANKGHIEYTTASDQLCADVKELVHSLGGYCSSIKRKAGYKDKNGEFVRCKDSNRMTIQFSANHDNPFYLQRKANAYKPKRTIWKRYVANIEYIGEEECQCIYIDDPSHLYITDDYIITHNTTIEKFFLSGVIGWYPNDYNLFYSHSGDITRMFYDGMYDIVSNNDEYTWNEIFPNLRISSTNAKMEQFNVGKYKPFPSIQCTTVGAKNSGKVRASRYLGIDDMIGGFEEATNPKILDKLFNNYSVDARQRKTKSSDGTNCKEIIIATRWSVNDVIGRVIRLYDGDPRVKIIAVPDIDEKTGESNFMYEYGGFDVEFFKDQQKVMDEISYRCLYKQDPIEREGLLFPSEKLRRYLELPHGQADIITGQCDTKGKGTDYFVLPVLAKYGDDYYCIDAICNNSADYELQYENAANIIVNNEVQECEFERNAGGDRVAMEVNKRVQEKGWVCNITDAPTETNKEARIFQTSAWIIQHVIFKDESMYDPNEPYGIMMGLLTRYSVSAKKQLDDVPDVFSNFALRKTKENRVSRAEAVVNPFRRGYTRY